MPPRLSLRDISFFERPVRFARPFRFGAVVINAASQLFVRAEIDIERKGSSTGASAELLVPKWFDKRGDLSPEQTVDELRRSLEIARGLYLAGPGFDTAFGLHAARIEGQIEACAKEDIAPLAAAYGPAEIDKAILDALLRGMPANFFDGMAANIAGVDARLSSDLNDDNVARFLAGSRRLSRIAIRHTVGLDDPIEGKGGVADKEENAGARYFKLKLNGDPPRDAARLKGDEVLRPIAAKLLYIEQPMPRDIMRTSPLGELASWDFIIDEADDSYDAFPVARALGYRGISSKSCKGLYKSIINATRAAKWGTGDEKFFVTGEDLTCQAGLSVQQDTALGALIGITHAERNGHHYVDGFGDTPVGEAEAFLAAHPGLYERHENSIRLAIHDGQLSTDSLASPGFAANVHPDWSAMTSLQRPKTKIAQEQSI